ncbi:MULTISPECIES: hypothetical protein [unclassified Streptomyces]|uniref:hypothetical protein n=1 Tax=unclassified Streptomyces TaxID=2593676 RepID=UPI002E0F5365|nr:MULTISPECIES: hypothetical protein [unclassified Streptomyces]WSR23300.1 hypothetical protein OG573_31985 [Streptomyces sp. NBC_01205]
MSGMFGKVAAVAAVATAVVTLAGAPASAADTAYNTRSVWLDGIPRASDADACTTRSMTLASGNYTWTQIFGGSRTPSRDLYLAAGTYTWTDCIRPWNGYYQQTSSLSKPGLETAYLNDQTQYHWSAGTYTFGSLLDPHF